MRTVPSCSSVTKSPRTTAGTPAGGAAAGFSGVPHPAATTTHVNATNNLGSRFKRGAIYTFKISTSAGAATLVIYVHMSLPVCERPSRRPQPHVSPEVDRGPRSRLYLGSSARVIQIVLP